MQQTDNTGETGIKSIRVGGMRLQQLPIAEAAHAKAQLPEAIETDRKNKIEDILAKYPSQRVSYLKSRIQECHDNVARIETIRGQQNVMIAEYTTHITMCKFRDEEIAKIAEDDPDKKLKLSGLMKRFPPYNIEKMKLQIQQCTESIERATEVIAREYTSIAEFSEVLGLCVKRDAELKQYGVRVG